MATESLIDFDAVVADKPSVKKPASSLINFDEIIGSSSGEPAKAASSIPVTDSFKGAATNIARTSVETIPSASAGLIGFGGGMAAGARAASVIAPLTGPAAPYVAGVLTLGGGLGGAFLSSGAAQKVTDWMHQAFAPEDFLARQAEKKAYPYGTFGAQLGTSLLGMSPKAGVEIAGNILTKPIVQRGASAGLMGAIDAGSQYVTEGKVDPIKVGASMVAGAAMPSFNPAGQKLFGAGQSVGNLFKGKKATAGTAPLNEDTIPTRPPEDAPDVEKQAFVDKIKAIKAERDANSPLVESALRNKETGNVERMGPRSDPIRKLETADTHEQGFVTERGQFLTRQEAIDQAKRTKQIPEDYVFQPPPGEQVGLHTGDLRKAGDERFAITEEQPAGVPKPPVESTAPVTREDFKALIDEKELRQGVDLEDALIEARRSGTPEKIAALEAEDAQLTAEIKQLRKDIPPVKFADINNPTSEELQDSLWGTRKVGQAFDRIISSNIGTPQEQLLAKLLNKSQFIRNADLKFKSDYLEYVDSQGRTRKNGTGLYAGEDTHAVTLGKEGDVSTLLHEAIHAATVRLLYEGNSVAAKKLTQLHKEFLARYETEYQLKLKEFRDANPNPTVKELSDFRKANKADYGLTNVREFVAEAFTNKKFQELLASIESKEPSSGVTSNLWEAFKNYVREGLNIPPGKRTAFDDVMDSSITLIDESKQFSRFDATSDAYLKGVASDPSVRGSPTEPTSVKETIDEDGVITKTPLVDTTKTDPRDVRTQQEFEQIATDIYEKYGEVEAVKFFEGYEQYKKTWLEPIKETEKFVGINLNNKLANSRIVYNESAALAAKVPNPARREAIAIAVDKGDLTGLSPQEIEVANQYSALVADIGKRAVDQGVVKGLLEDYVTHIIDWSGAPKDARAEFVKALFGVGYRDPTMSGMDISSKFAKQRTFKTFENLEVYIAEANARIEAMGKSDFRLRIKTKDIAELYKEYATSMEKAIENKKLVDNLKQVRNVVGESLIKPVDKDNPMPTGWSMMDSPQFAGNAVHPDMVPALKFVFDAGPGDLMKALGAVSQFTKRFNVVGSFFHAKSLMEVLGGAKIPIWTPLKEGVLLAGADKASAASNKYFGTKFNTSRSAISQAVQQFREGGAGDNVDRWIKDGGLKLELPEDVSSGIISATGKFADDMIGKYGPKTRVLEKSLSVVEKYTLNIFDKYTWDYLHTGGKLMVADAYLDRARQTAAEAGKPFDEVASRKEISRFVNDSFGGLDWFDAATQTRTELGKRIAMSTMNPEGRRALQVALFAPDWTISTLRAFTAALPKQLNPTKWNPVEGIKGMMTPTTKADYARLYQFKTALTYFTLLNAINMMTADRPIWGNKDPTRIEWPDGTSMQAMKHAMEPYHWLMDPDKTFANKLGFVPKAAVVLMAGTEYASPNAPKIMPREYTGNTTIDNALGRVRTVVGSALPFQIQAAAAAPEGEGVKRALLGTMGLPVYGSTPEQRKLTRQERSLAEKENTFRYHENEIKAGREKRTEEHQKRGRTLREQRRKFELEKAKE